MKRIGIVFGWLAVALVCAFGILGSVPDSWFGLAIWSGLLAMWIRVGWQSKIRKDAFPPATHK